MEKSGIGKIEAFDGLLSTGKDRNPTGRQLLRDIPLESISDFPGHPFKVRMDEDMENLVESVRKRGVLSPVLVRPLGDGSYQMVSGHRRKRASEIAGFETVPCMVRELNDCEAIILMLDSNLQRERVLPSERAFAYKMKLEAMKRQGQRTDLTSCPVVTKFNSAYEVGKAQGMCARQVFRYIRLTSLIPRLLDLVDEGKIAFRPAVELSSLIPRLLDLVDEGKIAFRPAVELSWLSDKEQAFLAEIIAYLEATPSLAQAVKLKKFSQNGTLSESVIRSVMSEEKPNQREKYSFQADRLRQYIPAGLSQQQREDYVVKALAYYKRARERQRPKNKRS